MSICERDKHKPHEALVGVKNLLNLRRKKTLWNFPRKTFFSIIFSNKQNHSTLFPNGRFHIVIIFMALRANIYSGIEDFFAMRKLMNAKASLTQPHERINAESENVGHEAREKNLFKINLYFIQTAICIFASFPAASFTFTTYNNHPEWCLKREWSRVSYCIHYSALTSQRQS